MISPIIFLSGGIDNFCGDFEDLLNNDSGRGENPIVYKEKSVHVLVDTNLNRWSAFPAGSKFYEIDFNFYFEN